MNNEENSFKNAIIDLRTTQDEIRKRIETDLIKENESVIKEKVAILLEKELYSDSDDEEIDSSESDVNSVTIIDNLLDDIDLSKISDEDLSDDEGDSSLNQDSEKEKQGDNDEGVDETYDSDFDKLINEMSLETKKTNKNKIMTQETKTEDEIEKMLSEIESMVSNQNDDEESEKVEESTDEMSDEDEFEITEDDSDVDIDDLDITEEELLEIVNEMSDDESEDEISEGETESSDDEVIEDILSIDEESEKESEDDMYEGKTEATDEDQVEEGLAFTSQTKKTVGSKSSAQRDGAPERRSNISEMVEKLQGKFAKVLAENKAYADKIQKLEEKMGGFYEMAINSSKMTQMNKIITENFEILTREKLNQIVDKFSSVETIKESKETFNQLNESFKSDSDKILQENIDRKIGGTKIETESAKAVIKSPTTKNSLLNEEIQRMKDILEYTSKKPKSKK